jgi:hypothetical protein
MNVIDCHDSIVFDQTFLRNDRSLVCVGSDGQCVYFADIALCRVSSSHLRHQRTAACVCDTVQRCTSPSRCPTATAACRTRRFARQAMPRVCAHRRTLVVHKLAVWVHKWSAVGSFSTCCSFSPCGSFVGDAPTRQKEVACQPRPQS